jgi:hypothetical protein
MRLKTGKEYADMPEEINFLMANRLAATPQDYPASALSDINNPHPALRATLPEDGEG